MGAITPLTRSGLKFVNAAGTDTRVHGITGFSIVDDLRRGERQRVVDYLAWARTYGVNCIRFFLMWQNLELSPKSPGYWTAVREAFELCISMGLYPWPVRYCDQIPGSRILLSNGERAAYEQHLAQLYADFPWILDEYMNEPWKNGDFAGQLARIGALVATRGSANDTQKPDAPGALLDWTTHHTPRGSEQTRKFKEMADVAILGFPGWDPSGRPPLAGEPPRINQDDWTDPQRCADYYAGCDLFGAGGVIHGGYGPDGSNAPLQSCIIPTDANTLACMDAIADVWRAGNDVPVGTFSQGKYLRGNADNTGPLAINHWDRYTEQGENPAGALRTFAMQVGPRQIIVPVDRGPKWQDSFGMRNDYRLIEVRGRRGNIIIAER